MPTFLDLAQKVGSESGTVQNGRLTAVTDANDRVRKVVRWTRDAYRQIQNAHRTWFWLQDMLDAAPIAAGKSRYSAADLGLARFSEWDHTGDDREDRYHLIDPESGQAGRLVYWDWRTYQSRMDLASAKPQRPFAFTISPRAELVLIPNPDRPFVLRAPYRLSPQELVNDADVPEMPAHHHDLIVDTALVLLTTHDEAAPTLSLYQMRQLRGFSNLEREQLPRVRVAEGFC